MAAWPAIPRGDLPLVAVRTEPGGVVPSPDGMAVIAVGDAEAMRDALHHAAAGASVVALCLDPNAVFDPALGRRVRGAVEAADDLVDDWAVLCSGGLTLDGSVVDFGYYADAPHLTSLRDLTPLVAPFPGLVVARSDLVGEVLTGPASLRPGLDLVRAAANDGRPSYASPGLRYGSLWRPEAVASPPDAGDLTAVVRSAARSVRPDPGVSIVIRTVGARPALLRRALRATLDAGGKAEVVVVTDVDEGEAAAREAIAVVGLDASVVRASSDDLPSRWRNLRAGAAAATGEYVWFVDDVDHVTARSHTILQDALPTSQRPILLVESEAVEERWDGDRLVGTADGGERYPGSDWFLTFAGANRVPICSAVYPATTLDRLDWADLPTMELSEDYALFVAATRLDGSWLKFAGGGAAARISIRPEGDHTDNVVTMEDRVRWMESLAGVVAGLYDGNEPDQAMVAAVAALGSAPSGIRHIEHLEEVVADLRSELRRVGAAARDDRGARADLEWLLRRLGRGPLGMLMRRRPTFRRLERRWLGDGSSGHESDPREPV